MNQNTQTSESLARELITEAWGDMVFTFRADLRSMPCDRATVELLRLSFVDSPVPKPPYPGGFHGSPEYDNALANADLAHRLAVGLLTAEFLTCDQLGCDTLESADNNPTAFAIDAEDALRALLKHPLDHATVCKSPAVVRAFRALGELTPRLTRQIDYYAYAQLPGFARQPRQGRDILSKAKAARLTTSTGAMMI